MAVVAPMPSASVVTAVAVNTFCCRRLRKPYPQILREILQPSPHKELTEFSERCHLGLADKLQAALLKISNCDTSPVERSLARG